MKKKLLALAVAAALPMATQAANAEVTIYGKIHASIDYLNADQNDNGFKADGITPATNDSLWNVASRASRLGFKGSEDLGNGMKLIWKLESGIDVTGGSGGLSARNRYIGLAGNWGTFLYGIHDTPVKISTGKLDIFVDTIADYNLQGSGLGTGGLVDIRAQDAIAYVSPNFSGLTLIGAIVPDANYGEQVGEQGDLAGAYSIAAMYSNGGLFLAGGYESLDDVKNGGDVSHWRIGAGYDWGDFHIGGVYQQADGALSGYTTSSGKPNDYKTYTINGSYKFGNNVVKAMWLGTKFDDNTVPYYREAGKGPKADDTFNTWAIGLDHNFSKRSKVYVIYADSDMALNGSNFNKTTGGVVSQAREQSAFSLGMVHKF